VNSGSYDIVIVGGGPAGLSAALYAARALRRTVLFEHRVTGGQIALTSLVENYPGFADGINGYELAESIRRQAERYGAELRAERVTQIQTVAGGFRVVTSGGELLARAVILASGAEYRRLDVPGEQRLTGRGVSYCASCDAAFFREMEVAVVGGGDAALDEGLFVARFAAKVHLIHRRGSFRASRILQERVTANPKIEVIWHTVVESINGDDAVESVQLRNLVSGARAQLAVRAVFIFIGQDPNSQLVHNLAPTDVTGHLKVDLQMRTPIAGFFAVGDVREESARQAISAAGDGATAAIAAEHFLSERYGPPTPT
jgi:thioredoxin reductase (NADPH)